MDGFPPLKTDDVVWYDDAKGTFISERDGYVTLMWENGGITAVRRSDLLTQAEYEEIQNG